MTNTEYMENNNINLLDDAELEDDMLEDTSLVRPDGYTGKLISSPLKAIRENCIECCSGSKGEVKLCTCTKCPLWPFRLGKNPYRKGRIMTDEQKQAFSERIKTMWANKKNNEN